MSSPSRCVTVNCGSAPKSRLTTICVRLSSNSPESDHSKRISDSVRMPILQCSPCKIDASRIFGRALRTYLTNGSSVAFAASFVASSITLAVPFAALFTALFTASFTALSASVPTSDIITPYVSAIITRPAKDPRATPISRNIPSSQLMTIDKRDKTIYHRLMNLIKRFTIVWCCTISFDRQASARRP